MSLYIDVDNDKLTELNQDKFVNSKNESGNTEIPFLDSDKKLAVVDDNVQKIQLNWEKKESNFVVDSIGIGQGNETTYKIKAIGQSDKYNLLTNTTNPQAAGGAVKRTRYAKRKPTNRLSKTVRRYRSKSRVR